MINLSLNSISTGEKRGTQLRSCLSPRAVVDIAILAMLNHSQSAHEKRDVQLQKSYYNDSELSEYVAQKKIREPF